MNFYKSKTQSGYVLITGLILILVITIVTTSSMQGSNLDYKISSNSVFKDIAFQSSESGRTAAGEGISYYIYNRDFTGHGVPGLSYTTDYDPKTDSVVSGEDLYNTNSLTADMFFDVSDDAIEDLEADISIVKAQGVNTGRSGVQQLSGYRGAGKSAAAGGVHLVYEIRSTGIVANTKAVAVTASEFRVIP